MSPHTKYHTHHNTHTHTHSQGASCSVREVSEGRKEGEREMFSHTAVEIRANIVLYLSRGRANAVMSSLHHRNCHM